MLTQLIWAIGISLEVLVLLRGARERLIIKFPLFYTYLAYVLLSDLIMFFPYRTSSVIYARIYWPAQFLGLLIGCVIIFEIYRVGLRAFPGTARMARNLLLFVFAMVFAKALVTGLNGASWWSAATNIELERNLRIVQSCALLALVAAFLLYAIPLGRNLKGILLGYGIFLGVSVVQLTFMNLFGVKIEAIWPYLQPVSYLLVLCIWTTGLWSLSEEPTARHAIRLEDDYRMLHAATQRRFRQSRAALSKAVRP
jgi:hypothetical protein